MEVAQTARSVVERGMKAIISQMSYEVDDLFSNHYLLENRAFILEENGEDAVLRVTLSLLCKKLKKPLILLIDEIDALVGDTLISVLRQLRAGYIKRPAASSPGIPAEDNKRRRRDNQGIRPR